jgi:uncharacterized glyoxalase superfamily protein PhnB
MSSNAHSAGPRLLPVMQYRDLGRAIAWLGSAFGFEEHHVVRAEDGSVQYAVVRYANALIMLGPVRGAELNGFMKQPDETGGAETQSCYLVVEDADAHYARAKAAGAAIVFELKEYDYGGRGYSCRDPEGHIWTFGTYDPWGAGTAGTRARRSIPPMPAAIAVLAILATAGWLTAVGLGGAAIETLETPSPQGIANQQQATAELNRVRAQREFAESALAEMSKQAAADREARQRVEQARDELSKQLAAARDERQKVEGGRDEVSKQVSVEREAKQRAESALGELRKDAAAERDARRRADQARAEAEKQVAAERDARRRAERALGELTKQAAADREARQQAERAAQNAKIQGDARKDVEGRFQQLQRDLERERNTVKTLQEQLRAASIAKEEATLAAQAALNRLAAQEATRGEAGGPVQGPAARAAPVQKEPPQPKPSGNVTREAVDPMPALVP